MIYRVSHLTEYQYSAPVTLAHHLAHLRPRETPHQIFRRHELEVTPHPAVLRERIDSFGNHAAVFVVQMPHHRLQVYAVSEVEVLERTVPGSTPAWETVRDGLPENWCPEGLSVYQFIFDSPLVKCSPELADYAAPSFEPERPVFEAVRDLTRRIHGDFKFDPAATTVSTPLQTVLMTRRGVCQDFAHLQIGCLRSLGLAARYVSGYIETDPPPGQERLLGCDASHAWASFFCPGAGWIDLDPTNDTVVAGRHITVAWGRDYSDISPLRGVILGGGQHTLRVGVSVSAMENTPELFGQERSTMQQISAQQQ